jgi:hypothetical protein
MRGMFDYRGECFGHVAKGCLYDLEGQHVGYVDEKTVTALDHTVIWHRIKDGLYNKHWESIGYLGEEVIEDQRYE